MVLSKLQQFILKQGRKHGRMAVDELLAFYSEKASQENQEGERKAVRKSIDRLIKRELVVGYGEKTTHRLYINEVRLTSKGRKAAGELLPKQQRLGL